MPRSRARQCHMHECQRLINGNAMHQSAAATRLSVDRARVLKRATLLLYFTSQINDHAANSTRVLRQHVRVRCLEDHLVVGDHGR
jgi:predicted XRE-type DNA-binding protein